MTGRARSLVAAVAASALWIAACSDPPAVPIPDLATVEPAVAEKIRTLHAAVLREPTLANWTRYAKTLHAHDMRTEALEAYRAAERLASGSDRFELLYLGGACAALSDPESARRWLEEAAGLRGDYAPLFLRLGDVHEKAGRLPEARQAFERAAAITPSSHALLGSGRVALSEGRIDDAVRALEAAAAADPEHAEVRAILARAYSRAGKAAEAQAAAAAAGGVRHARGFDDPILAGVISEGVSFEIFERMALEHIKAGDPQGALGFVDRAIAARPDSANAHVQRGRILGMLGRTADAAEAFDRAIALRPDDPDALAFKAGCLLTLKRPEEAIQLLAKALTLEPDHVNAHVNVGIALQTARPDDAIRHLQRALAKSPRRIDARLVLASIFLARGRREDAAREARAILEEQPGHPAAQRLLNEIRAR